MKEVLSVFSGLLYLAAFVPYITAIVRNETKPARSSWLIWAFLDTIILAGMFTVGAVNGQIAGAAFGSWAVVALATRRGASGWTTLDKFCLGGAILAIALWQGFHSPLLGIVTSLVAYSLGFAPTIASALKDSSSENKLAWALFWVSSVCALVAIPAWTLVDAAQPSTFLVMNSVMLGILFVRTPVVAVNR